MAKSEITVNIADLPIVNAKIAELDRIGAALRGEQPFPHTEIGDAIHNLRGRAETAERALAELRAAERAGRAAGGAAMESLAANWEASLPGVARQLRAALAAATTEAES